jgi:hypothetical protein
MKKSALGICLAVLLLALPPVPSFAAEKTVTASLPPFQVQINGTLIDSKTAEYPLLLYKNITYMPMTYDYCNLLGLESSWTPENGLAVSLRKGGEIPTVIEHFAQGNNPSRPTAAVVSTPVTVNGKAIDNAKEPYPFLRYNDVTYFPLTFRFTHEEFNIYSNFAPEYGLAVYSENKFYYEYHPVGSDLLQPPHKDLRISTILYSMTAINIFDGTGEYPSNNVSKLDYYRIGTPMFPNYGNTKNHYGFLPDGAGGLRVNTDSHLRIGDLITSVISDPTNLESLQTEVEVECLYYDSDYSDEFPPYQPYHRQD